MLLVLLFSMVGVSGSADTAHTSVAEDPLFSLYLETRFRELVQKEKQRSTSGSQLHDAFAGREDLGTQDIVRLTSASCPAGGGLCDLSFKRVDAQIPEL